LARAYENVVPPRVDDAGRAHERQQLAENRRNLILQTFTKVEPSSLYEKQMLDDPQDAMNNLLLAIAYLVNDQNSDGAKKMLEKVQDIGVTEEIEEPYHEAWGTYFELTKEWDKARKEFQTAKRKATTTFAMNKLREVDKLEREDLQKQEAAANDPEKVIDKRFTELVSGAKAMISDSQAENAVDLLEEAVRIRPNNTEAVVMLAETKRQASLDLYMAGKLLVDQLNHAEAYDKFEKAVRFDPSNASASMGLEHVKKRLAELDKPKTIRRFVQASGSVEPTSQQLPQ
jgi:tetratricopeptide (TPR) repeat protein